LSFGKPPGRKPGSNDKYRGLDKELRRVLIIPTPAATRQEYTPGFTGGSREIGAHFSSAHNYDRINWRIERSDLANFFQFSPSAGSCHVRPGEKWEITAIQIGTLIACSHFAMKLSSSRKKLR
jgi:hypothetical protein